MLIFLTQDAGAPELYDPNGNMYIEYTLDYFLANAYAASEEAYNIDYYQYISPFVGRWLNSDGSGEGYYFYSDEYMTYAYADGAIEPLAWSCYLDESHSLVDNSNMTMFSLNNGELTDSEGNTYYYSNIEFPYDVADSSFYGYWQYDSNPEYYVQISREGDIVKINNEDGANTGYFEMVNPFTMNLFDNDGNRICRLSITGYRQAEVNGEETLFYYDDVPKG